MFEACAAYIRWTEKVWPSSQPNHFKMSVVPVTWLALLCILLATVAKSNSEAQEPKEFKETAKRVINGVNAGFGEFPWQISLRFNGQHKCGGSLLSTDWVVTAAHCVDKNPTASLYTVHLGAYYLTSVVSGEQIRQVSKLYYHSYFSRGHFRHDVALLKLAQPAVLTKTIQTISLPIQGSKIAPGTNCYLSGWGRTVSGGPMATTLQKAVLPIAQNWHCSQVNYYMSIDVDHNTMLCAGGRGSGGCQGDSGGPLACYESGRWRLRGISSWGHLYCDTRYYTVFARVSSFVNWFYQTANTG